MKKLLLLAMVLGFLVSGCAANTVWLKNGKDVSDSEFRSDSIACRNQVFMKKPQPLNAELMVNECMRIKGYTWGEKGVYPTGGVK
jgi:hypothetical protein